MKIVFSTQFCMEKATTSDDLVKVGVYLGTLMLRQVKKYYTFTERSCRVRVLSAPVYLVLDKTYCMNIDYDYNISDVPKSHGY